MAPIDALAEAPLAVQQTTEVYVGPRSFRFGETLHCRDRETSGLLRLLITQRIVLLHSPSGAGKTSLIQANLVPAMQKKDFEIPMFSPPDRSAEQPIIVRLNREPEANDPPDANRYVLSALLSLEVHRPEGQQRLAKDLAGLSFDQYLEEEFPAACRVAGRSTSPGNEFRPLLLLFDQFEEFLTLDPTDQPAKEEFVRQVGSALRNPGRWALFAIRGDFLGALEPYFAAFPTHLAATFPLDPLRAEDAVAAIVEPARRAQVEFADGVVSTLIEELRQIKVQQADGAFQQKAGPYIEPVLLQVVCQSLWNLKKDATVITHEHLSMLGAGGAAIDSILAMYYAAGMDKAARDGHVSERKLRDWIGQHLISAHGVRRSVLLDDARQFGVTLDCLHILDKAFLIRRQFRSGAEWYELAHDRLIKPIRDNNQEWERTNLNKFQQRAHQWILTPDSPDLLFTGEDLETGEAWAKGNEKDVTDADRRFLEKCRTRESERDRKERDKRLRFWKRLSWAAAFLIVLLVLQIWGAFHIVGRLKDSAERLGLSEQDALASKEELAEKLKALEDSQKETYDEKANTIKEFNRARIFYAASMVDGQSRGDMIATPLHSLLIAAAAHRLASRSSAKDEIDQDAMEKAEESLRKAMSAVGGLGIYGQQGKTNGVAVFDKTISQTGAAFNWLVTSGTDNKLTLWKISEQPAPPALPSLSAPPIELPYDDLPPRTLEAMGKWLVVQGKSGAFTVWNLGEENPNITPAWQSPERGWSSPWISRYRNLIHVQVVGPDHKLGRRLLDLRDPKQPKWVKLDVGEKEVFSDQYSFSPDGKWFALIGLNGQPIFWNLDSNTRSNVVAGTVPYSGRANAEFSSDGKRFIVCFNDGTVRIWRRDGQTWNFDAKLTNLPIDKAIAANVNVITDRLGSWAIAIPKNNGVASSTQAMLFNLSKISNSFEECGTLLNGFPDIDLTNIHPFQVDSYGKWLLVRRKSQFPGSTDFSLWDLGRQGEFDRQDPSFPMLIRPTGASRFDASGELVRFSADNRWLIFATQTNYVQMWDLWRPHRPFPWTPPVVLRGHDAFIVDYRVSDDSSWLVSRGQDNTIRTWDLRNLSTSTEPREIRNIAGLNTVTITPDRHWLAVSRQDNTFRFWNTTKDSKTILGQAYELKGWGLNEFASLQASVDSRWVLGYGKKKGVLWYLADANKPQEYCEFPAIAGTVTQLVVDPKRRWLATTILGGTDIAPKYLGYSIHLWSIPRSQGDKLPKADLIHKLAGSAHGFDSSGKYLICETDKGIEMLNLTDLNAKSVQASIRMRERPLISADNRRAVIFKEANRDSSGVELWDLATLASNGEFKKDLNEPKGVTLLPSYPADAFISANSRWLVMKNYSPELRNYDGFKLWDLNKPDNEPIYLPRHDKSPTKQIPTPRLLLNSPDHGWLLTIENKMGTLWDLSRDAGERKNLPGAIDTATFSSDSAWLVAADEKTIHTWNLKDKGLTHREIRSEDNKGVMDGAVAVSPNGQYLTALGRDYRLRFWDLNAPAKSKVLYGHTVYFPFALFIAPDGSKVISFDRDREIIRVSTVSMDGFQELADRVVGRKLTDLEKKQYLLQDGK